MNGEIIKETKKIYKVIKYIMLLNIVLIIGYNLGSIFIKNTDLIFRGWVSKFYLINIFSLIITGLILIKEALCSKLDYKFKGEREFIRIVLSIIITIIIGLASIGGLFILSFTKQGEHKVIKENREVIARVTTRYHDTYVDFYEGVGPLFMRGANIATEKYNGPNDPYKS